MSGLTMQTSERGAAELSLKRFSRDTIPDGSTVYLVLGDLMFPRTRGGTTGTAVIDDPSLSTGLLLSLPMQTMLKRLAGELASSAQNAVRITSGQTHAAAAFSDDAAAAAAAAAADCPPVLFVGGRTHGQHVSVARRMMRWFRDFRLPNKLMVEELSMTQEEQVFYTRSLLLAHRFRRGKLVILCRHAELSRLASLFHHAFQANSSDSFPSKSGGISYRFINVIVEGGNQKAGMTDAEVTYSQQQCTRFRNMRPHWPYGKDSALLGILATRSGALLLVKRHVLMEMKRVGGNVDTQRDRGGRTALHIACALGHYDCAYLLLKLGANVNEQVRLAYDGGGGGERRGGTIEDGATPLHFAVAAQRLEIVELLIEHGASLSATVRASVGNLVRDPDGMDLSHPSFTNGGQSAFAMWDGCLLPYEIIRSILDRQDRNSQSAQPTCTAIMFLTQPISLRELTPASDFVHRSFACKKLIFVRHGESLYNAHGAQRMKGIVDAHLTVRGYKQCQWLANVLRRTLWLESLGVSLVCVSPLARALQTYSNTFKWFVDEMNAKHGRPKIRVHVDPRLSERLSHSSSQGSPRSVLEKLFPDTADFSRLAEKWWHQSNMMSASSFESDENLRSRTQKFLRWVAKQPEECILVVGHGACMRMMLRATSQHGVRHTKLETKGESPPDDSHGRVTKRLRLDVLGYSSKFDGGNPASRGGGTREFPPISKSFRCNLDIATCLLRQVQDT